MEAVLEFCCMIMPDVLTRFLVRSYKFSKLLSPGNLRRSSEKMLLCLLLFVSEAFTVSAAAVTENPSEADNLTCVWDSKSCVINFYKGELVDQIDLSWFDYATLSSTVPYQGSLFYFAPCNTIQEGFDGCDGLKGCMSEGSQYTGIGYSQAAVSSNCTSFETESELF